jgi:hypothetical protein
MYKHQTPPDICVEFEYQIRNDFVMVKGHAWGDQEGIYRTRIADVTLEGVSVIGLLTEDDLSEIDDAIEPVAHAEAGDSRATGSDTIPGPYPTLYGDHNEKLFY